MSKTTTPFLPCWGNYKIPKQQKKCKKLPKTAEADERCSPLRNRDREEVTGTNEQEKARAERLIEKFSKMDDEGKMFLCAYADGMLAAAEMLEKCVAS